jgi:hypothetical protein
LHVLDVLSHFEWARKDQRFSQMLRVIESKADGDGRFTPESIWSAWKDWDFSQKKVPSQGLTFFVQRILKSVYDDHTGEYHASANKQSHPSGSN